MLESGGKNQNPLRTIFEYFSVCRNEIPNFTPSFSLKVYPGPVETYKLINEKTCRTEDGLFTVMVVGGKSRRRS